LNKFSPAAQSQGEKHKSSYLRDTTLAAWPEDGRSRVKLQPRETAFIRFTFLEPISHTFGYSTHTNYLGIESSGVHPKLARTFVEAYDFYGVWAGNEWHPTLPKELAEGKLLVSLYAGTKKIPIGINKIQPVRIIREQDWRQKSAVELFNTEREVFRSLDKMPDTTN
jgi:hypothetical protein